MNNLWTRIKARVGRRLQCFVGPRDRDMTCSTCLYGPSPETATDKDRRVRCQTGWTPRPNKCLDGDEHDWALVAHRPSGVPGEDAAKPLEVRWCKVCGSLGLEGWGGKIDISSPLGMSH